MAARPIRPLEQLVKPGTLAVHPKQIDLLARRADHPDGILEGISS